MVTMYQNKLKHLPDNIVFHSDNSSVAGKCCPQAYKSFTDQCVMFCGRPGGERDREDP